MKKAALWTKDYIIICIINLILFFGYSLLTPTFPMFIKDIGGNDSQIGMITSVFTIASLVTRPFSGMAIDRIGRKVIFILGIILIGICMFLYSWCGAIWMLLILRVFNGIGVGLSSTASAAVACDVIPHERFGEGMGFFSLTNSIGMAVAPVIGLGLMAWLGFRSITLFSVGTIVISIVLALFIKYRKGSPKNTEHVKFAPYEKDSVRPSIIVFFIAAVYGSVLGFVTLYANSIGVENIGLFFTICSAALLITRPMIGKLIDRFGFNTIVFPGFVMLIIAMILLSKADTLPMFLASGVFVGIGYGSLQTSLQTMAVVNAPRERQGAANATFFTGMDGGMGFGSLIAGMLSTTWGYSNMYLSLSVSVVIGAVLYFLIARKIKKKADVPEDYINERAFCD